MSIHRAFLHIVHVCPRTRLPMSFFACVSLSGGRGAGGGYATGLGAYPQRAGQRKNRRGRGHNQQPEPGRRQSRRGPDQRDARLGADGYCSPAAGRPQDGGGGGEGGELGLEEMIISTIEE